MFTQQPASGVALSAPESTVLRMQAGARVPVGARVPWNVVGVLAALAAECCLMAALTHPWLNTTHIASGPIAFFAALLFFGRKALGSISLGTQPMRKIFVAAHLGVLLTVLALHRALVEVWAGAGHVPTTLMVAWIAYLVALPLTLAATVLDGAVMRRLARRLGAAWVYAAGVTSLALSARTLEYALWDAPSSMLGEHLASASFAAVASLAKIFIGQMIVLPQQRILGTHTFRIHVAAACSGVEGLALTLALALGWLVVERKNLRVGRALWLVPAALMLAWMLNIVRMAALVMIGAAGYARVAISGFHTEAGWIAFGLTAIAFLLAASRLSFLRRDAAPTRSAPVRVENPATAYLLPLVVLLAASLVSRALSAEFETLYALRVVAVGAVMWALRRQYAGMLRDARWVDALAGVAVGAFWIAYAVQAPGTHANATTLWALRDMSATGRNVWLAGRVLGAVLIVPFAEELAFRGFLLRRLQNEEFDRVPFARAGWIPVLISSVAFGLMHGNLWLPGVASGVVFAFLAKRRNGLGGSLLAHAMANAVLAIWVIARLDFFLW